MSAIDLQEEGRAFAAAKARRGNESRQEAALFLTCGIDLAVALSAEGDDRRAAIRRIERLLERERLKGCRRHWSYDLNRHIALKQALDRLRSAANENPRERKLPAVAG